MAIHIPQLINQSINQAINQTLSFSAQAAVLVEEFLSFMVILNYIIPISMYVTVGKYNIYVMYWLGGYVDALFNIVHGVQL